MIAKFAAVKKSPEKAHKNPSHSTGMRGLAEQQGFELLHFAFLVKFCSVIAIYPYFMPFKAGKEYVIEES